MLRTPLREAKAKDTVHTIKTVAEGVGEVMQG